MKLSPMDCLDQSVSLGDRLQDRALDLTLNFCIASHPHLLPDSAVLVLFGRPASLAAYRSLSLPLSHCHRF